MENHHLPSAGVEANLNSNGNKDNNSSEEYRPLSQEKKILAHLLSGKSITPIEALNRYGSFRLASRIWDLRSKGYNIVTRIVSKDKNRVRYAEYHLISKEK